MVLSSYMDYKGARIERLGKIFDELKKRDNDEKHFNAGAIKGGIFTNKTRSRLRGFLGGSMGRDMTLADFWYDVRTSIKSALYDLALFVTVASQKDVSSVITVETLDPIFEGLLRFPVTDNTQPDHEKARVADFMIHQGFYYLSQLKPSFLPPKSGETINEALSLSEYLCERFKSESRPNPEKYDKRERHGTP